MCGDTLRHLRAAYTLALEEVLEGIRMRVTVFHQQNISEPQVFYALAPP